MHIINNGILKVSISRLGAEIKSVQLDGEECIWQGDNTYWSSSAPILFPICGSLKDNAYLYGGKRYSLGKHGFAKDMPFDLIYKDSTSLSYQLSFNEQTLAIFPFRFRLIVEYRLDQQTLSINYIIKNNGNEDMSFSIGAHEGYFCKDGIEDYHLQFEKKEDLISYKVEDGLLTDNTYIVKKNSNVLPLRYDYFVNDSLIFKHLLSKRVILFNKKRKITLQYNDFPYLLIWSMADAPFVCIEPWHGLPDKQNSTGLLSDKEGILRLAAKESASYTHSITFEAN